MEKENNDRKKGKRKKGRKEEKENENRLRIEINRNLERIATTFKRPNLKIEIHLWKRAALRWKSARNTSITC